MSILSTKNIVSGLKGVLSRFPLTIALVLILGIGGIVMNHLQEAIPHQVIFFVSLFCATEAFITLAISLYKQVTTKPLNIIAQIAIHILWLALTLWLTFHVPVDHELRYLVLAASACVMAVLSLWVLPFIRSKTDVPLWHFMVHTIIRAAISIVIGLVLYGALVLLLNSFTTLFSIDVSSTWVFDLFIFSMVLVMPITFMLLLPHAESLQNTETSSSKLLRGLAHYLVLPITGIYMLTLYAYAAKILFTWQLPDGHVSLLVTALFVATLALLFLIYPTRNQEGEKLNHLILRWLPLAVLPLLVLMTVAIGRRIGDYGLTMPRIYLLLFNLWALVVCIILFLTRTKRFSWVIISFALGFFIASIGPWSMASITLRSVTSDLSNTFASAGFTKLPLTQEQYQQFLSKATPIQQNKVVGQLEYLKQDFTDADVARIITPNASLYSDGSYCYSQMDMLQGKILPTPQSRQHFMTVNQDTVKYTILGDDVHFTLTVGDQVQDFTASKSQLGKISDIDTEETDDTVPQLSLQSKQGAVLFLDRYYMTNQGIDLEGILFF